MALYSVWDWDRNAWAVYRDKRPVSVGDDPKAPKPSNVSAIGADPDTQVNLMPSDARFIGYDHMCRGEVRRRSESSLSGLGIEMPSSDDVRKYVLGGAVGALLVWYWRKRERS
jgi:hypothetical protein